MLQSQSVFCFFMHNTWETFALYRNPRVVGIFLLGFSSGLPFLLTLGTLHAWMKDAGISNTVIGLFAWATVPYALKFFWAPFVDVCSLPFLTRKLGQRRGWMVGAQVLLMVSLIGLGLSDPSTSILQTAFWTTLTAFAAATQDTVIEAFRLELLEDRLQGVGAGASVFGFRFGMWLSGGGALYLTTFLSWSAVYALMGAFVLVGLITVLSMREPKTSLILFPDRFNVGGIFKTCIQSLRVLDNWKSVFLFIFFFKLGDAVLNMMSIPFLIEVGYSTVEIANMAKTLGITAMIVGALIGGVLLSRFSLFLNLMGCTLLQVIASLLFMNLSSAGHDLPLLAMTMVLENLACGMSGAAIVAYLSSLCHPGYAATHYAILSSFASFSRIGLGAGAGWISDRAATWTVFYGYVAVACIPAVILLWWGRDKILSRKVQNQS